MYKKFGENLLYWLAILFLIGSMYVYIFYNDQFKWQALFGTDGLTFFGLLVSLISMVSLKIPKVRKLIGSLLLKLNWSQVDYRLTAIVSTGKSNVKLDYLIRLLQSTIKDSGLYTGNTFDLTHKSTSSYKIFHRGIGGNLLIKKLPEDAEAIFGNEKIDYCWKVEIDGVSSFRIMEKSIKFLVNCYLDVLSYNQFTPIRIDLQVSRDNTELNLIDKGLILGDKNYKISYSNIKIESINSAEILLDSTDGISLTSRTKGDFTNALEVFKNVLIS